MTASAGPIDHPSISKQRIDHRTAVLLRRLGRGHCSIYPGHEVARIPDVEEEVPSLPQGRLQIVRSGADLLRGHIHEHRCIRLGDREPSSGSVDLVRPIACDRILNGDFGLVVGDEQRPVTSPVTGLVSERSQRSELVREEDRRQVLEERPLRRLGA
ncbi:MAG TPA: hypothetical protein VG963_32635, partial [Polyangiaceae bacterium]|nr:hypothetical protein [Polyangiaceae bacterium]